MKLYGKKFLRGSIGNAVSAKQETRDAILWDKVPASRVCRCKIQGSNELIITHYPQNWSSEPSWMKPGTAIRIVHVGGDRGKIEVAGLGRAIPTPVAGNMFPTIGYGTDGVLTDCYVTPCPLNPRMAVLTHIGTYRISGVTISLTAIALANGANYMLGDGGVIGDIAAITLINAAPAAGLFRYDLISGGTSAVVDYTAGTAAASPVMPSVGASHVVLSYIFVYGGTTKIIETDIGHEWTAPTPSVMTMVVADEHIYWADPVSTTVTLQVLDQYGNPAVDSWVFGIEIVTPGNGTVSYGSLNSLTKIEVATYSSSIVFTYTRDKLVTDRSPMLKGSVSGTWNTSMYAFILLYDGTGVFMP